MLANMGLFALVPPPTRGFARLPVASSWQVAQLRVSVRCNRVMVSVFLPDGRSTVTATAVQPADSARLTNLVVTSKLSVVYNWYQMGPPRALITSSTPIDVCVERICKLPLACAARAAPTSPSRWNARWLPTGHRTIGELNLTPKSSTDISNRLTSTNRFVRN